MTRDLLQPTKVIIPVKTAIQRTKNWRDFLKSKTDVHDPRKLPKAVYISRTDIEDLAAQCRADESLVGVRAYFTLTSPLEEEIQNEIKFVMVPVRASIDKQNGEDVIYVPGSAGRDDSEDDSNVYDYTIPCPDCCDDTSPLFGDGE